VTKLVFHLRGKIYTLNSGTLCTIYWKLTTFIGANMQYIHTYKIQTGKVSSGIVLFSSETLTCFSKLLVGKQLEDENMERGKVGI
jgi:hypothetical protein